MPNLNPFVRYMRTSKVCLLLLIGFALALSACSGGSILNPNVKTEFSLEGWAWAERQDQVISADGKYALVVRNDASGQTVDAVPLDGQEHVPVTLYSAPGGWVAGSALSYRALGWTKAGDPIFVAFGYQNQGPNVGKRGVAILSGNLREKTAGELAFMDLPQGELHTAIYLPAQDKVLLSVSGAIWSLDVGSKKLSTVKAGLPTYDGLFYPRLSPDGKCFVYELFEEGRRGVYLLDASSGSEKALLPWGETMSFIPQWSPDGKYVAAYTVNRKAGEDGNAWEDYDYFPGEDGPMPISPAITVVDTSGKVVRTISLEGSVLSSFKWSCDSKSLSFVSGAEVPADGSYSDIGMPIIPWDGVWTVPVSGAGAPVRLAALKPTEGQEPSFIYPLAFDAENKGVYYQFSQAEDISVWYARPGQGASSETPLVPAKIADGYWHYQERNPVFGEHTAALISSGNTTELWFLGPEFRKMDAWGTITTVLLGYSEDTVLLYRRGETSPATITVISVFGE